MINWTKIGIVTTIVAIIAILLIIVKYQHDLITKQTYLQQSVVEMKQLNDGVVRDHSQFVTKDDLEKFAKDAHLNLDTIRDDLKKLGAEVQGIGNFVATTPGYQGHDLPSTNTISRPDNIKIDPAINPYGYLTAAQVLAINETLSEGQPIPFGEVRFKAWQPNPWDLSVYPRLYKVDTVLGQDEEGRHFVYNKFTVNSNGKDYPVIIKTANFVEQAPEAKFRFAPKFSIGLSGGVRVNPLPQAEFVPTIQANFFQYGSTKLNPDWMFIGLGVGYETQAKRLGVVLTPAAFNIGKHLPLLSNVFIGPSVTLDTSGNFGIIGGISVGL